MLFALFGVFAIGYFSRLACLNYLARGPMVYFPAGPARSAVNLRTVELPAFFLDRFEITNRQYRLCMEAGVCLRPSEPQYYKGIDDAESDRLPVVWVNAYQAASFCNWIGRRLPTQAEWERAARGSGSNLALGEENPSPARINIFLPEFPNMLQGQQVPEDACSEAPLSEGIMGEPLNDTSIVRLVV